MATNTFQGLLRTFGGRSKSAIDARNSKPTRLVPYNPAGPIQLVLTSPANGTHEVGFLPAGFAIDRVAVISPGGAGTYSLVLPAYNGLAAVTVVAALADATDDEDDAVIAAGRFATYAYDRPINIVTASGVTGTFRLGLFGFPLDTPLAAD